MVIFEAVYYDPRCDEDITKTISFDEMKIGDYSMWVYAMRTALENQTDGCELMELKLVAC